MQWYKSCRKLFYLNLIDNCIVKNYLIIIGFFLVPYFICGQIIIEDPGNVPQQSTYNELLLKKVEDGDTVQIKKLLDLGANIDAKTFEGVTPIIFAVSYGYTNVVKLLLKYGPDLNKAPYDGRTAINTAGINDNIEIGELLILAGANIHKKDRYGYDALHNAVLSNYYSFVDMLLYYNANADAASRDGSTSLNLAAYFGFYDIVELLVQYGADIELADDSGFTPLMSAAQEGHYEVVKYLLGLGVKLEKVNSQGQTALCYAVRNGHLDIVKLLIENGADYNYSFNNGYNVTYLADKFNQYEVKNYLKTLGGGVQNGFYFDNLNIYNGFSFSNYDILYNLSLGVTESNANWNAGFLFITRLGKTQILEEKSDYIRQLREHRSYIGVKVEKGFDLVDITNLTKFGVVLSGRGMFSYGKYEALKSKPKGAFIFSPVIGAFYRKGGGYIRFDYQYLNNQLMDFPVNRFMFGVGYQFSFRKDIVKEKKVKL